MVTRQLQSPVASPDANVVLFLDELWGAPGHSLPSDAKVVNVRVGAEGKGGGALVGETPSIVPEVINIEKRVGINNSLWSNS